MNNPMALELRGVSKAFDGRRVLHDIDLQLRAGEVHALLGQNGSGKSTLIKILAGYHPPERGAGGVVHGEPFELGDAASAREAGIRFIHQDLGLVGDLDVVDNLALGDRYTRRWWLSDRQERRAAQALLMEFDVDIDGATLVRSLAPAQQTLVALVRAIRRGIDARGLLVLDEPTASLPSHEVKHLFALIRQIRERGGTVLYVTHRLPEVFEVADRVTVLRDGRHVCTEPIEALDHDSLVERIVGRPLSAFYATPPPVREDVVLEASEMSGGSVTSASLTIHSGEIVGVTGLVGSGYEDLLYLIFGGGRHSRTGGTVTVAGVGTLSGAGPHESILAGLALAPADRKRLSAIPEWTLRENVTLPLLHARGPLRWMTTRRERADAQVWLDRLQVTPAEPERMFSSLSGGNQQKVVLSRWLRCGAEAFLLDEPTAGVDVGSKQAIYAAIADAAREGAAILMASSDPEELCAVCDRVLVMRNGALAVTLAGDGLTPDSLAHEVIRETPPSLPSPAIDERNRALHV